MKHHVRYCLAPALMAAALACAPLALAADKDQPARNVTTVHVSGHGGDALARKANEMHARMEAEGWRFHSLVPHSENQDTEGLWLTYVRD